MPSLEEHQALLWQLERRVSILEQKAAHTEEIVQQIKSDTTELISLFKAGKVGAVIFRWIIYIAVGVTGIIATYKGFK